MTGRCSSPRSPGCCSARSAARPAALLGVSGAVTTELAFLAAYRRVRDCFGAIFSVTAPRRRRRTAAWPSRTSRPAPGRSTPARPKLPAAAGGVHQRAAGGQRLHLTDAERAAFDGCTGLDATPVPLFSRGPSKRTGLCAATRRRRYVREADHREREDDKGKPLRKIAGAWRWIIATTARPPARRRAPRSRHRPGAGPARRGPGGTAPGSWPLPPPAGTRPAGPATTVPTPRADPGDFSGPPAPWAMAGHGLPDRRAGIQANTGGAILVEGTWTAPPCPARSITATTRLRTMPSPATWTTSRSPPAALTSSSTRTARRRRHQRLSCPATASSGPICPLREASISPRDGRAKVLELTPNRRGSAARPPSPSPRTPAPLPPGPALRQPGLAQDLRHLAQHHRRPQRPGQRPAHKPSPSPPGAASAASPPSPSYRAAPDRRQHPQDPRLAGPHRPGKARITRRARRRRSSARRPPRRLTGTSSPRHLDTFCWQVSRPRASRSTTTALPHLERPDRDQRRRQNPVSY